MGSVLRLGFKNQEILLESKDLNGCWVTVCRTSGPICTLSVVVPTLAWDNSGLPHTLEHLIFCGSEKYPQKGYLDALANLCLANGTNAYTSEDHTSYTVATASFEGLLSLLPVYLDHICEPIISKENFGTEVFHLNNTESKKSGVVYSEMTGRVLSEADLLDRRLRELIYSKGSTLAYECGGWPFDIEMLSSEKIIKYHRYYYHPSQLSLLVTGPINAEKIFNCVSEYLSSISFGSLSRLPDLVFKTGNGTQFDLVSSSRCITETFPSSDESIGSIGIGFYGPGLCDVKTLVALNVLFRALCESSASPLHQAFVECNPPIANSVDYELKYYLETCIFLVFSGVENGISSGFEDSYQESTDDEELEPEICPNKLSSEFIHKRLLSVFHELNRSKFNNGSTIENALQRHIVKFYESLEEDTSDIVYSSYLWDVLIARHCNVLFGDTLLGGSLNIQPIFDDLSNAPLEFWLSLFSQYCLTPVWNTVIMVPDRNYFQNHPENVFETIKEPSAVLGTVATHPADIDNTQKTLCEQNPTNSASSKNKLPLIDHSSIEPFLFHIQKFLDVPCGTITAGRHVTTKTNLFHFNLCFDLVSVPNEYFPYLVLFQELLFQSPMLKDSGTVPYQSVVEFINGNFLNLDASVGFGNSTFSCTYLSNAFVIAGTTSSLDKFKQGMEFVWDLLAGSIIFDKERLVVICQNLFTEASESMRDGQDVINTLSTELFAQRWSSRNDKGPAVPIVCDLIENGISIFSQYEFLGSIIEDFYVGNESLHLSKLAGLLGYISRASCFVQLGSSDNYPITHVFESTFRSSNFCQEVALNLPSFIGIQHLQEARVSSPYVSMPIICGICGLTTTHMSISIPCEAILGISDYLENKERIDYFSLVLLCQLFSRTEGPMYEVIRGKGLAYDASIHYAPWNRQLEIFLFECVDPKEAYSQILSLFSTLKNDLYVDAPSIYFTLEALEMARSSCFYHIYSHQSSPSSILSYTRQGIFRGMDDAESMHSFDTALLKVTLDDLKIAFLSYFSNFLLIPYCDIVLVCEASKVSFYEYDFRDLVRFNIHNLPNNTDDTF